MDAAGSCSSAELAKLLQTPVVLAVDCTKSTRTVSAVVLGCQRLDPHVPLRGVILNQIAGRRHESVLREAIEQDCGLPVLGSIARLPELLFRERHLGLVPPQEHDEQTGAIQQALAVAEESLDLDALWAVARDAPRFEPAAAGGAQSEHAGPGHTSQVGPPSEIATDRQTPQKESLRIGVFRDAAFQFYYPENLEALCREGARLVEISPLRETDLPDVDALYIGGGFPETLATTLTNNQSFLESLRRSIERGLPVYAECGGAVFLGEKLLYDGKQFPMAAVLPVVFDFHAKPKGHGYSMLETVEENPFFPVGHSLRGHEFHYTCLRSASSENLKFAFRVHRGYGFDGQRDGLCVHNVLASYTHVHALGTESWGPALVRAAARFKTGNARP